MQIRQEMFGDISFLGVHIGVWQGCQGDVPSLYVILWKALVSGAAALLCVADVGMAIGARAQAVGAELYDMRWPQCDLRTKLRSGLRATLSLVPIVVPEEVSLFARQEQQAAWQENSITFAMRMAQVERQGELRCRTKR